VIAHSLHGFSATFANDNFLFLNMFCFIGASTIEELVNNGGYCTFPSEPVYGFDKLPCKSSEFWKM